MDTKPVDILGILPAPFEWCEIPGNPAFQLLTDAVTRANAGDKGTYAIDPFFMAKYQTTYEQFQVFVDDPQGFTNPEWWQGLAASNYHRSAPGKQHFTYAKNLPRENVSWYDAVAFCAWLSSKDGYVVRLPTEWEWQWAAQGPDRREYPWGPKYIKGYANVNADLEKTAPVGSYPQGASPYGVLDLSGNVWEWCLSEGNNPANTSLGGAADRVMRGGAWGFSADCARAVYRGGGDPPDSRGDLGGFRVVGHPPSL